MAGRQAARQPLITRYNGGQVLRGLPFFYLEPVLRKLIALIGGGVLLASWLSFAETANRKKLSVAPAKKSTAAAKSGAASKKRRRTAAKAAPAQTWRSRQLAPTPDRYKEIQQALIAKGYLAGEPTGQWDGSSADALRRFQKEQNLEATGKIDSLSLIALGLGPRYDRAAATPAPKPPQP
jgi:hypothetical protein